MTKSSLCRNLVLEQAIEELITRNLVPKNYPREKKCFLNDSKDTNYKTVPVLSIITLWNILSFIVTVGFVLFLARDISLAFVDRHNASLPSPPSAVVAVTPNLPSFPNVCNTTHPLYQHPQSEEETHLPLSKVMEELGYHAYHTWKNIVMWKKTRNAESLVMKVRSQLRPVFDRIIDIAEVVGKTMMFVTVEIIKWIVIFVVMLVDFAYTAMFISLGLLFEMLEAQALY